MKKQFAIFFYLVILCSFMTSYSHAGRIKVIASIAPLADFAKQVGGERVDIKLLLPPGASPHTYEPTPKVIKDISDAEVFLKIGAGFEFWAEKIIKVSENKKIIVVETSEGIPLIRDEHVHKRVVGDPHIWLDPLIAAKIVTRIEREFKKIDPGGATYYEENAVSYTKELTKLDRDITGRVKKFRTKDYVTFHPAWNYFSRRYGLEVVGVIEEFP
jgi:zinc transport system substrate-binding protein